MSPEGAGRFSGRGNRGVGEQRGQVSFVGGLAQNESSAHQIAAALAAGRHLTGDSAYRFVTTVNTITNWRTLPADQVLDWATNPAAPLPGGAQLDLPWPPPAVAEQSNPDSESSRSLYKQACATVLRRADELTTTRPKATSPTDDGRAAAVEEVTHKLGTPISEAQLWAVISPTPHLDAKRTLFAQLASAAPIAEPTPGDLVCYDFTTSGPARCSLVIQAGAAPAIAALNAQDTLVAQPMPANSVIIESRAAVDGPLEATGPAKNGEP